MGELSKIFLAQFYDLPGDTVKGKHQSLFRLFHQHHSVLSESEEDLEFITTNLKPTSHLEKIFRIDFLIYFRRFKELYQEFENGDEITMLKSQLIKLTPSQLKIIYCKDSNLIPTYLEERTKHDGNSTFMDCNPFFVYLAQNNSEMFSKLFKKYKFKIHLGHRTTKRFVHSQKDIILAKPEPFINILKKDLLIRKLGNDLKYLLFKMDPDKSDLYWKSLLKYYPKKQQFDLYKSTYNTIYNRKFGENINTITEEILKMIPDPSVREKLAKLKLKKEENEEYFKYVTPNYCLNEFMSRLSQMTTSERMKFIRIVTECCILNEDLETLLKVVELVAVRFKNDDRNIRDEFLAAFGWCNNKIFDKFNEQHWKFFVDIITTIKVNDEWVYNEYRIRLKYLEFLVKNNKPLKETIKKYTDWTVDIEYETERWKDHKIYKKVLCELIKIGFTDAEDDDKAAAIYYCNLASLCQRYNRKNPKDPINIYHNPKILKSIKKTLESENSRDHYIYGTFLEDIQYIICRKDSTEQLNELKTLCFKNFKTFGTVQMCLWFLKHEPVTLQENFDQILNNFVEIADLNSKKFWRLIKKYNHLEFDKRTVEFCITKLKEEGFKKKKKLAKALSMLASPAAHLEFMKSYIPTSTKVDLTDEETKEIYEIQCELLRFLHFIKSPAAVLPMVLEFCKGDYLKSALTPLYSCIYKLPENQTKVYIEKIGQDKALSVKKHAMNLSCVIYDKTTAFNALKNASVPSLLPTLKYFAKNPSDAFWDLLDHKLAILEKQDVQVLKWAIAIDFSLEYKSKYVEAVWTVLDKYENNPIKKLLIKRIGKNVIERLSLQFAYEIIERSILKFDETNDFVSELFIHINDNGKFKFLSKILSEFKENCWKRKATQRSARRKLFMFVQSLFKAYMNLKKPNQHFANEFLTMFESLFRLSEAFEEFVIISFMKVKNETPENCAKFCIELANNFIKDLDKSALNVLADAVNNQVLPHLFKNDNQRIEFCYFVFKFRISVDDYLLVSKLLPESEPEDTEHFKFYDEILTALEQVTDNCVELQFNLYLKSECSEPEIVTTSEIADWSGICVCPAKPS